MRVTKYSFGHIEVDGKPYEQDLVITPDSVHPHWWRKEGHCLSREDLDWILAASPEVVVIGQGYSGCMAVPDEIYELLKNSGADVFAADTPSAVREFNNLVDAGRRAVAALHLTC